MRNPEQYQDFGWHQIECFQTQRDADLFATLLRNKLQSQHDLLVRVTKRPQNNSY